jgi:hypothetical protein
VRWQTDSAVLVSEHVQVHSPRGLFTSVLKLAGCDASHRLLRRAARAIQALFGSAEARASFEHIDSSALQSGAFRASDSLGLDGAPSIVFLDTMPTASSAIDRSYSKQSAGLALGVRPARQRTPSAT